MKKIFTLLICLIASSAFAQNAKSGTITGTTCFGIDTTNAGTVGISVQNAPTGSAWTGTIQPSASIGGDPASNIQVTPAGSSTAQGTITANGVFYAAVSGSTYVQVCGNTVTNTAAIKLFPAQYSKNFGGGGGSGSGTVSANNTAAGAVANYAAAGGSTTVGPTTLNYVAPTLTVSTAAGGNGVLALSGNTSGTVTFTAPATAGTTTNAVVSSNNLQLPVQNCAAPALTFAGFLTTGVQGTAGPDLILCQAGNPLVVIDANIMHLAGSGTRGLGFTTSATDGTAGNDLNLSRGAANMLSVGNGTAGGNEQGLVRSANSCATTADTTLTVNTVTNICQFSLPAISKAWIIHCSLPWVISAGTGTNTIAIGVNASQTPATTTNLVGVIETATTGTQTNAVTALSASGATSIITSGTITPGATFFPAYLDGTLSSNAAAGTFTVTMTAAGTTVTASAKSGAYCRLE